MAAKGDSVQKHRKTAGRIARMYVTFIIYIGRRTFNFERFMTRGFFSVSQRSNFCRVARAVKAAEANRRLRFPVQRHVTAGQPSVTDR
jgi:hypothetical protein